MNNIIGLATAFVFVSQAAIAQSDTIDIVDICLESKKKDICEAYVTGLVDGYVTSKQKYLPTHSVGDQDSNSLLERALATRVSDKRLSEPLIKPLCLPETVNRKELVNHVLSSLDDDHTSVNHILDEELKRKYACEDNN